jgi:tetratricopeptide (TPR) repeat protein
VLRAAALIDQDLSRERTPATLGAAVAVATLDARYERAELLLQEALLLSPTDDRLHNDLGVVLWSKARRDNSPVLLAKALERFGQALSLRAGNDGASRNRALLLREFGLAAESPLGVAEDDASVVWARERERLERAITNGDLRVAAEIAEARPQATRLALEDGLIARTLEVSPASKEALRAVVEELARRQGDRLLTDDLLAFERLTAKDPEASLVAHSAYAAGRALHLERRYGEAELRFRHAADAFARAGSPMEFWARYYWAVGLFHRTRMDQADAEFERLDQISRQRGYPILEAHVAWMEGLSAGRKVQIEPEIGQLVRAQGLFRKTSEFENEASVAYLLGYAFAEAGDFARAWRHQIVSTQALSQFALVRRKLACLDAGAFLLERMGLNHAAFEFQNAALSIAEEAGETLPTATTYRSRAETQLDLGRIDAAADDAKKARFQIAKLSEPEERADLESELDRIEARILRDRGEALGALGRLEVAQEVVQAQGLRHFLVEIERERARALSSLGRFEESASLLEEMGREWEARRNTYSDPTLRRRHQELGRSLLEDRVRGILAIQTSDRAALSLAVVEEYRAKESRRGAASAEVPARLAPMQVALEYLVLPEKTLRWRLDSQGVRLDELAVGQAALASAVATLRGALMSRVAEAEIVPLARALHHLLVPADTGDRLTVVPDGPLHELPFAALQDEHGRYLVERSVIAIAATLRRLASSADETHANQPPKLDIFAISGDAFATDRFRDLQRLDGAPNEAREVAALWDRGTVETGLAATAAVLRKAFCSASVLHVAAHGLASQGNPNETDLLLAPTAQDPSGRFEIATLPKRDECRPRLVVLSACNSARGAISTTEGLLGAAHELHRRGVPAVVATLWAIDDNDAASLFSDFHRTYRRTRDAAEALAEVQREWIRTDSQIASRWASVQALSG